MMALGVDARRKYYALFASFPIWRVKLLPKFSVSKGAPDIGCFYVDTPLITEGKNMLWVMKVELVSGRFAEDECIRFIEIDSSSDLVDMHNAIQSAVNFDNDHLYDFFANRTGRIREEDRFDLEEILENIFPLEGKKSLFYLFDFGDDWLFKITKTQRKPKTPPENVEYPRVVESIGGDPDQYPIFDDEE